MTTARQRMPVEAASEAVRTRRVEVVDATGLVRLTLTGDKDCFEDAVGLTLLSPDHGIGLGLDCTENGAWFALFDPRDAEDVVTLTADPHGALRLVVRLPGGRPVVDVGYGCEAKG